MGAQNGPVGRPLSEHIPAGHVVRFVEVTQQKRAEMHGALINPFDDEIRTDPWPEYVPYGFAQCSRGCHVFAAVSRIRLPVFRQRVRHVVCKAEPVAVDDARVSDTQTFERLDALHVL